MQAAVGAKERSDPVVCQQSTELPAWDGSGKSAIDFLRTPSFKYRENEDIASCFCSNSFHLSHSMRFKPAADPNSEDERVLHELLLNDIDNDEEGHGFAALNTKQREPFILSSGDEADELLNGSAPGQAGPLNDMYNDYRRPEAGPSNRINGYASTGRTSAYGPSTSDKGKKQGAAVLAGLANGGSYVDLPRASANKTAAVGGNDISREMSKVGCLNIVREAGR